MLYNPPAVQEPDETQASATQQNPTSANSSRSYHQHKVCPGFWHTIQVGIAYLHDIETALVTLKNITTEIRRHMTKAIQDIDENKVNPSTTRKRRVSLGSLKAVAKIPIGLGQLCDEVSEDEAESHN